MALTGTAHPDQSGHGNNDKECLDFLEDKIEHKVILLWAATREVNIPAAVKKCSISSSFSFRG